MTVAGRLEGADPEGKLAPIGMGRIEIGPEEALASTDRPVYVIYHLGELLGVPVTGERDL